MASPSSAAREMRANYQVVEEKFRLITQFVDEAWKDYKRFYVNVEQLCQEMQQGQRCENMFQHPQRHQAQANMCEPVYPPPSMPPGYIPFFCNMAQTTSQTGAPQTGYAPGMSTAMGPGTHLPTGHTNGHGHGYGMPPYVSQMNMPDQQFSVRITSATETPPQSMPPSQQYEHYAGAHPRSAPPSGTPAANPRDWIDPNAVVAAQAAAAAAQAADSFPVAQAAAPAPPAAPPGMPAARPPAPATDTAAPSAVSRVSARPQGKPSLDQVDVYICGGEIDDVNIETQVGHYHPQTETFVPLPRMRGNHGKLCAAAISCGKLYIFGGQAAGESVTHAERYDPATGDWEELPPMPTPRTGCAAAAVAGEVYACGGYDSHTQQYLSSVDKLDPQTNQWEAVATMPTARSMCSAAGAEMNLYVFGGSCGGEPDALNSCERFVPSYAKWEQMAPMLTPRRACSAAASRGLLYVFGGSDGNDIVRTGERLEPSQGRWVSLPPMSNPRSSFMMGAAAGVIYVFGGHDGHAALSTGERFEINKNQWLDLPEMPAARSYCIGAVWSQ